MTYISAVVAAHNLVRDDGALWDIVPASHNLIARLKSYDVGVRRGCFLRGSPCAQDYAHDGGALV